MKEAFKQKIRASIFGRTPIQLDSFDDFTKAIAARSDVHVKSKSFFVGNWAPSFAQDICVPKIECVGIEAKGNNDSKEEVLFLNVSECFELGTLRDSEIARQVGLQHTQEVWDEIITPLTQNGNTVIFDSLRGRMDDIGITFNNQELAIRTDTLHTLANVQLPRDFCVSD